MPRCLHQRNNDLPNKMYENETKKCMIPASDVEGVPSVLVSQTEGRSTVNKSLHHGSVVLGACQHQRCPGAKKEYGLEACLTQCTSDILYETLYCPTDQSAFFKQSTQAPAWIK